MPDQENPSKPAAKTEDVKPSLAVADVTEGEYHELADEYLDNVVNTFEEIQDSREEIDVEFSVCSLVTAIPLDVVPLLTYTEPRPASLPSAGPIKALMLSTSNHPTSRSGCHLQFPGPSGTTGASLARARVRRRALRWATGSTLGTAAASTRSFSRS